MNRWPSSGFYSRDSGLILPCAGWVQIITMGAANLLKYMEEIRVHSHIKMWRLGKIAAASCSYQMAFREIKVMVYEENKSLFLRATKEVKKMKHSPPLD